MPPYRSGAVCFSFDIDWAPEFMIDELGELIEAYDLPATIFCTHRSAATERLLARPQCETGVHPNFLPGPAGSRSAGQVLEESLGWFPAARGVRNHALYYSSRLLPLLHRANIRYLSNDLLFLQPGIEPRYDFSGMVRLPIFWEDDVHCVYFHDAFDDARVDPLDGSPGLKVLNFHPVHLYLNTRDLGTYMAAKDRLRDPDQAPALRNPGRGVRTLFEAWAAAAAGCMTLGQVAAEFRAAVTYQGRYEQFLAATDNP